MAVNDINSNVIANAVASPTTKNNPAQGTHGHVLRNAAGLCTPNADDSENSVQRYVRVPSNARVCSVKISNASATTAGAIDIGVYDVEGGDAVDQDLFASALDLSASAKTREENIGESTEYTITERSKPLWEVLGLSSDPKKMYDVAATVTTTFNGGPTAILLEVEYVA